LPTTPGWPGLKPAAHRPEHRAVDERDARLDTTQCAACDAMYARRAARAACEARQLPRPRPGSSVHRVIQPDDCDR
jgi:hypothetical protein